MVRDAMSEGPWRRVVCAIVALRYCSFLLFCNLQKKGEKGKKESAELVATVAPINSARSARTFSSSSCLLVFVDLNCQLISLLLQLQFKTKLIYNSSMLLDPLLSIAIVPSCPVTTCAGPTE